MIDNKIVMQQALDALIEYDYAKTDKADELGFEVICALREAIAEPEQTAEAVAWMTEDGRVASNATKQMSMVSPSNAAFNIPLYLSCNIAQPAHESIASDAIECVAQPVQPNNLEAAVFDAWEHYARMGSVCRFEGRSMIYASTLEEIYEEAIAQPAESPEPDLKWCGSCGEGYAGFCRAKSLQERCPMTQTSNLHALLCAEAYQVVGSLLSDLGQFDTEKGRKVLDNLSQGCVVHDDVLPWPSFVKVAEEFSIADLALKHFGEYSEKHYDFAVSLLDLNNVEVRGIK